MGLKIPPYFSHILLIGYTEFLHTRSFFRKNNPMSRDLKDHNQAKKQSGLRQQRHSDESQKIRYIHGVAGYAINYNSSAMLNRYLQNPFKIACGDRILHS